MVEFCGGKELYPFHWVVGVEDMVISFKFLICSFSLSISLRVVGSGEANIIFEEVGKFFSKGRSKLETTIGDESIM